ncbi:hypothetical protein ACFWFI_03800 [Streptomyces sp. NPDC060209]|uniref:hypothetical protein n=1 Tax=Streptomyces sp. NPDC060209 TaxID=3347073 RepID=UPI003663EDD8
MGRGSGEGAAHGLCGLLVRGDGGARRSLYGDVVGGRGFLRGGDVGGELLDAWLADDVEELDAIWDEILQDFGTDWDKYANVSSIGWAA